MQHSTKRILTTHAGSLPRPPDLLDMLAAKEQGQPVDEAARAARLPGAVKEIVQKQIELGIDVIDDGEYSKPSFVTYVNERLGGFEVDKRRAAARPVGRLARGAVVPGVLRARATSAARQNRMVCTGPITYKGHAQLQRDIANLKAALGSVEGRGVHAGDLALQRRGLAAQRLLQDRRGIPRSPSPRRCARNTRRSSTPASCCRSTIRGWSPITCVKPDASIADCRKWASARVEALNHALRDIPPEKVRHHTCYGINMGPRVHDMEVKDIVDIILKINAGAYSFEAANPRHEHEWKIWENAKLPKDKMLIPGVISHSTVLVEHPELVAERIGRFASAGRARERDRRRRLRLRHLRRLEGGPPEHRLGEVPGA